MPRAKATRVDKVAVDQSMSGDVETLPVFSVGVEDPKVEVGSDEQLKKPKAKSTRKPKPCERCEERRKREREYARSSRMRAKSARSPVEVPTTSSDESTGIKDGVPPPLAPTE